MKPHSIIVLFIAILVSSSNLDAKAPTCNGISGLNFDEGGINSSIELISPLLFLPAVTEEVQTHLLVTLFIGLAFILSLIGAFKFSSAIGHDHFTQVTFLFLAVVSIVIGIFIMFFQDPSLRPHILQDPYRPAPDGRVNPRSFELYCFLIGLSLFAGVMFLVDYLVKKPDHKHLLAWVLIVAGNAFLIIGGLYLWRII